MSNHNLKDWRCICALNRVCQQNLNDYAGITGDSTWNFKTQHRDGNDSGSEDAADDILTGGLGADQFVDNTNAAFANSAVGIDTIADFNISQNNQIVLDQTTFNSANDLVYNSATGGGFYHQNGTATGFDTGGQFLTLTGPPGLTASQFLIQA